MEEEGFSHLQPYRLSLRAANSFATSIRQSLSVLCLWLLSIARLLNLVCVVVERSHGFSLRMEEKDLSPTALVAGHLLDIAYIFTYGYDFTYHTLFGFRKLLYLG